MLFTVTKVKLFIILFRYHKFFSFKKKKLRTKIITNREFFQNKIPKDEKIFDNVSIYN